MTELQTAAQAVIDRWDRNEYTNAYLGVHITTLRKALEAEQAQAVEPVGYFCSNPAGDFRYQVSLKDGYPESVPLYTHPAPAMHLSEILAEKGIKLRTEFEPKPDHIVDASKMVGERAALLTDHQELNMCNYSEIEVEELNNWANQAHDMLEADAREIGRLEQCRIDEAETTNKAAQASRDLLTKALNEAQQVAVPVTGKRKPLSASVLRSVYHNDNSAGDWHSAQENYVAGFTAAERLHGITPQGDKT